MKDAEKKVGAAEATWVVTGGAGFIGSNFVRLALAERPVRVVVVDKLTYAGNLRSLADVEEHPRYRFVHADIADRLAVTDLYLQYRPQAVLNFAAESHVDRSIDDPDAFVRTNVNGTFELLEGARRFLSSAGPEESERFRLLHVSTDEVYGSLGSNDEPFSETTPYAPSSPYAASKAAADHFVRAYHRTFGLPAIITNCSNNYGPFQYPEKLIPLMILNAVEAHDLPIYGKGDQVRDWIHVEDHCRGILRALEAGTPGEKYNLGGDCEKQNIEIVRRICAAVERLLPAADNTRMQQRGLSSYRGLEREVPDRPGHDQRYAMNIEKVRRELDWEPRWDLGDGLEQTVAWYLENVDWCEAVQADRYRRERLGLGDAATRTAG